MRQYLSLWRGHLPWPPADDWRDQVARIAEEHGFIFADLLGRSHKPGVTRARHHAWAELQKRGNSLLWIGQHMDRHHTTVLLGIRAHLARTRNAQDDLADLAQYERQAPL
jgi:chromosomal replication initiation ATPase DnaA